MKKVINIIIILLFTIICCYSQNQTTRSIYSSYSEATSGHGSTIHSKKSYQFGCHYDIKKSQFIFTYNDYNSGLYMLQISINDEGKNTIRVYYPDNLDNIEDNVQPYSASCCIFKDTLYLFATTKINNNNRFGYYRVMPCISPYIWQIVLDHKGDPYNLNIHNNQICRTAVVSLSNKIMLFFVDEKGDLYSTFSQDMNNWSKPHKIDSSMLKSDRCNISACSYYGSDTTERIFLAYSSGEHSYKTGYNLKFTIVDTNGLIKKAYYKRMLSLNFVEVCYGSVNGGDMGNNIQIFLTTSEYYANNTNKYKLYRTEYNASTDSFSLSEPELLNTNYDVNDQIYKPAAINIPYISSKNFAQKKMALITWDYVKQKDYWGDKEWYERLNILSWNSNKLQLIDVNSYNSIRDKWHLIGVIEGVPPYVLNGDSLGTLITSLIFPSSIELTNGVVHSKQTTNTTSTSYQFDFGGSGYHWGKMSSESDDTTVTISTTRTFYPTFSNTGYRLFSKPKFLLSHYKEYDWYGNNIHRDFYIMNYDTDVFELEPFSMDTIAKAPSHMRFSSFINRNAILEIYDKYYSSNFQWAVGSNLEQTYEISTTKIKTDESFHGNDIGLVVELPINISAGFVATKDWSFSRTTTSTMSNGVTIKLQSTHGDRIGDTMSFSGKFYWIKPTDHCDNYWIPSEYKHQNPWLMTYAITENPIINMGLINSVFENDCNDEAIVAPNPASDYIEILWFIDRRVNPTVDDADDITIYNTFGECVMTVEIGLRTASTKIDISHLPAGIYSIKLGTLTKTFVKL